MTPTIGRIVHFRAKAEAPCQAATVVKAWSPETAPRTGSGAPEVQVADTPRLVRGVAWAPGGSGSRIKVEWATE